LVAPRVLELESKSILSGYLDHRLTQDVGIDLGDKEGIMDVPQRCNLPRLVRPADARDGLMRWTGTGSYSPTTSAGSGTRSTPRLKILRTGPGPRAVPPDGDRQ
jgi:hypothetical protein